MDLEASILISEDSIFSNSGTVFTPGTISFPTGASVSNSGYMQSNHNLNVNCHSTSYTPPITNTGSLYFQNNEQSCLDNLDHKGFMQITGSNVTLRTYSNDPSSTVLLSGANLHMSTNLYNSRGSFGGKGLVQGNFQNSKGATIMSSGDFGVTSLHVSEDFSTNGTIFFLINSRNLTDSNAFSVINAGKGVAINGGKACVCFNPSLELVYGDRWNVMNAQTKLIGRFDEVDFACSACPQRSTRSVASVEDTCQPVVSYGPVDFAILFDSCGGGSGSNFLTDITPPYYVIVSVAVGIILIVIILFGGALVLDAKARQKKAATKAKIRRKKMVQELQHNSMHHPQSSSSLTSV